MSSRSAFSSLLNIRAGEGLPILLLTVFSFLIGAGGAFFYTAATTLFLESYSTTMLPVAYIGSGIAGWLLWFVSSYFGKKSSQSNQMLGSLIFLIGSVIVCAFASYVFDMRIVSFVLFIWIRIVTYISVVVFWNLASSMFDVRQGKRLFGLIGAGEVLSDMIGFFSIPLLVNYIRTQDLLIIAAVALVLCLVLFSIIRKRYAAIHTDAIVPSGDNTEPASSVTIARFFSHRYSTLLFLLAFLPMIGIYFMDYIFFDQAKILYAEPRVLASFLGIFFGFVAVAEFIVKTVLSGRLLDRYGLRIGLMLLPAIVALAVGSAALTGLIFGIGSMFFAFVAFGKLMERVLRSGLNDPAFQILYQPLPAHERLGFQSMVEGVPKAAGNLVGGGILLLFTLADFHNLIAYNIIFFGITLVWLRLGWLMYVSYRNVLRDSVINANTGTGDRRTVITERLLAVLQSDDPGKVNKALIMISRFEPTALSVAFSVVLNNPSDLVRSRVFSMIRQFHSFAARKALTQLIHTTTHEQDRATAIETLEYLDAMAGMSIDEIGQLVRSNSVADRILAAKILGESTRFQAIALLLQLIDDSSPRVKRAALVAAGKVRRPELWMRLIEHLSIKDFRHTAASAIILAGGHIMVHLEQLFSRIGQDRTLQINIIRMYRRMGERRIKTALRAALRHPDKEVRYEALEALADADYTASSAEQSALRRDLDEEIEAILWTVAALRDIESTDSCRDVAQALRHELHVKNHRLFTILSAMYDARIIRGLRDKLRAGTNEERVYALEILDVTVDEQIKNDIVPLLEDYIADDVIETFKWRYPQERLQVEKRLTDIVWKDHATVNVWTKACALEALQHHPSQGTENVFRAFADHTEYLLAEIAVVSLYTMNPERYRIATETAHPAAKYAIEQTITSCIEKKQLTGVEKIRLFSQTQQLSNIPRAIIAEASQHMTEQIIEKGEIFIPFRQGIAVCAVLISGSFIEQHSNQTVSAGEMIYHVLPEKETLHRYKAVTSTRLLMIDREILDEIVWDYLPLHSILS